MYVHIIGAGLIGGSIALGLSRAGLKVSASDISPAAQRLSKLGDISIGPPNQNPDLVFVCTPPDVTAAEVVSSLDRFPETCVVDVSSVKTRIYREVLRKTHPAKRVFYIQSHPMAGREIGGIQGASADLFSGWPWIVCHSFVCGDGNDQMNGENSVHQKNYLTRNTEDEAEWSLGKNLLHCINLLGAFPVFMDRDRHDRSVAAVSHVPHILSSLIALSLANTDQGTVAICGSGIKDMTRLAASNPELWTQIIFSNRREILQSLGVFSGLLKRMLHTLEKLDNPAYRTDLFSQLAEAQAQQARIPKKPGKNLDYSQLEVLIPDKPGELSKVLGAINTQGINLEDLHFEHANNLGVVKLSVSNKDRCRLIDTLEDKWTLLV
ncbi:prephenate dehydrogenase [Tropheryma whipplei]|uniref:prephenate dehydrogenase n=1 Tax=Tropheryma whipplei TaxID=2039 RepID=UPI0004B5B63A|nr:prephenate dehydrogenase [Tropheryma whipplei]